MVKIRNGLARFLARQGYGDCVQTVSWLIQSLDGSTVIPNSLFIISIYRAYWILTGEILIDYRDARLVTLEQFTFVMH